MRIRQLRGHAPERERDDARGHLAHAEFQQQHAAIAALAHEALVSFEVLAPRRTLQKRVVAHPRHKLPAAVRAPGNTLAADLEPSHARKHALDVGARIEELVAAWLLALKVREASLIVADSLGRKRLLDLGVYIGAQDEVVLMADERPQVEIGLRGRLAQHEVDVSRVVCPLLLEAGVEVVEAVEKALEAKGLLPVPHSGARHARAVVMVAEPGGARHARADADDDGVGIVDKVYLLPSLETAFGDLLESRSHIAVNENRLARCVGRHGLAVVEHDVGGVLAGVRDLGEHVLYDAVAQSHAKFEDGDPAVAMGAHKAPGAPRAGPWRWRLDGRDAFRRPTCVCSLPFRVRGSR